MRQGWLAEFAETGQASAGIQVFRNDGVMTLDSRLSGNNR